MQSIKGGRLFTTIPFLMIGGLVLGTITAVSHHIFSSKVNGKVVRSNDEQQWYSQIGTGLAFLTKTFLTAAAGLAYTQLLWHVLR